MINQEIKKIMFTNHPDIWGDFVEGKISEELFLGVFKLAKEAKELEKKSEKANREFIMALKRNQEISLLHHLVSITKVNPN